MSLESLLSEVTKRPITALDLDSQLSDLPGWDSLVTVRLMLRIEQHLRRELSEDEVDSVRTVADVARLIE